MRVFIGSCTLYEIEDRPVLHLLPTCPSIRGATRRGVAIMVTPNMPSHFIFNLEDLCSWCLHKGHFRITDAPTL